MSSLALLVNRLKLLRDLRRNDGTVSVPYQTVMIEMTSMCNLDCPICPVRRSDNIMERGRSQIAPEDFRRIVDLTRDMTECYNLNMWGESVLHKNFVKLLDYASRTGRKIWFASNLNYSERLAEIIAANPLVHLICSLDGWDAASYAEYRWGGKFEVVRRNLAILAKGCCTIYPQYLSSPGDGDKRERFRAFVAEVVGQTDTILFKTKLDNIRNDPRAVLPGRCSSMYAGLYFNCDGILMPCCTNVREDVFLRHVSSYTTEELRNGPEIRALRKRILEDKDQFESCRACEGEDQQSLIVGRILDKAKSAITGNYSMPDPAKR